MLRAWVRPTYISFSPKAPSQCAFRLQQARWVGSKRRCRRGWRSGLPLARPCRARVHVDDAHLEDCARPPPPLTQGEIVFETVDFNTKHVFAEALLSEAALLEPTGEMGSRVAQRRRTLACFRQVHGARVGRDDERRSGCALVAV